MNDQQARVQFRRVLNQQIRRVDVKVSTLAKLVGVSNSQVTRWMQGDLMPDWRQFNRLLDIFNISDEYILGNSISENAYNKRFK